MRRVIKINGQKFEINYCFLRALASIIDDLDFNHPLRQMLIATGYPSLMGEMAYNYTISGKNTDMFKEFWGLNIHEVRYQLIDSEFVKRLTDEQAQYILNDPSKCMPLHISPYYAGFIEDAPLLSSEIKSKLITTVRELHDQVKEWKEDEDADLSFSDEVLIESTKRKPELRPYSFTREDLKLLPFLPVALLVALAENYDDIRDQEVQEEVMLFLMEHSDPSVKLALIANRYFPMELQARMFDDEEPDVRLAARNKSKIEDDNAWQALWDGEISVEDEHMSENDAECEDEDSDELKASAMAWMRRAKQNEQKKLDLDPFKDFLIKNGYKEYTPSGKPSTVYDYMKRVERVCENEGLDLPGLEENINKLVTEYDRAGVKAEQGAASHSAVINALKAFQKFVKSCPSIKETPEEKAEDSVPDTGTDHQKKFMVDPKEAIQDDYIICCICGEKRQSLTAKHLASHGLSIEDYKKLCGYSSDQPLMSLNRYNNSRRIIEEAQNSRK